MIKGDHLRGGRAPRKKTQKHKEKSAKTRPVTTKEKG